MSCGRGWYLKANKLDHFSGTMVLSVKDCVDRALEKRFVECRKIFGFCRNTIKGINFDKIVEMFHCLGYECSCNIDHDPAIEGIPGHGPYSPGGMYYLFSRNNVEVLVEIRVEWNKERKQFFQ